MKNKIVAGVLVLMGLVLAGNVVHTQIKINTVHKDWEALSQAISNFRINNCGCFLPSDTSWRCQERPTFETISTINPFAPSISLGERKTFLLTSPVPYIAHHPEDPFNPGEGYGYVTWNYPDGEPNLALFHSPGPDNDIDVTIERLFMILSSTLNKEKKDPNNLGGLVKKYFLPTYNSLTYHFSYDPTNGLISNGDMFFLFNQSQYFGKTNTQMEPIPENEMQILLEKIPPEIKIPIPRWKDEGNQNIPFSLEKFTFPVPLSFYNHFENYFEYDKSEKNNPLENLANKLEDFSDFFFDLKPLSEEQIKKLNQWKSVDETWWNLVKYTPSYKAESSIYIDAEKYAQFFVFYGKSLLLESACLISQGKYKESQEILNYLIKISWELETFYYIFNLPLSRFSQEVK